MDSENISPAERDAIRQYLGMTEQEMAAAEARNASREAILNNVNLSEVTRKRAASMTFHEPRIDLVT